MKNKFANFKFPSVPQPSAPVWDDASHKLFCEAVEVIKKRYGHPHDSGSLSIASRLEVNRFTNNQSAGLSRARRKNERSN